MKKIKKRRIITVLGLSITLSLSACGKHEPVSTVEPTETIEATTEQSETELETEETTEPTEPTEPTEEVRNKMFGLDDITASEDKTTSSQTTMDTRTDYPDSNSEHRKAWDNFCNNWNESDYGTTTAGKSKNDFPYYGDTGYDPKGTILQYRTTDKGYTVFYDTATGRVYYTGMTLPTGDGWDDITSGGIIMNYARSKGYNNIYDVTYAEFQEVLGVYNGD